MTVATHDFIEFSLKNKGCKDSVSCYLKTETNSIECWLIIQLVFMRQVRPRILYWFVYRFESHV